MWRKKLPKSIGEYIETLEEKLPEAIDAKIRFEVGEHVENSIMQETAHAILILERKATHLYDDFFGRLIEKGFTISFLRRLKEVMVIKGRLPKEAGIVVDCINTGKEIEEVKSYLDGSKCKTTKVYSYVANASGIKSLDKQGVIGANDIICKHKLFGKEFENAFKRLQIYYQSRIEPMDTDYVYNVYNMSPGMSEKEFEKFIEKCCQKALGNDNLELIVDSNLYLPQDTKSYSMDIVDLEKNVGDEKLVNKTKTLTEIVKIEYPHVRIKARFADLSLLFRMNACCPPENLSLDLLGTKANCVVKNVLKGCFLDVVRSSMKIEKTRSILCPQCIENYISGLVIDQINEVIQKCIGKRKISVSRINPVELK